MAVAKENTRKEGSGSFHVEVHDPVSDHRVAKCHLDLATMHHEHAAEYLRAGELEKSRRSSIYALGYYAMARELLGENVKRLSQKKTELNE